MKRSVAVFGIALVAALPTLSAQDRDVAAPEVGTPMALSQPVPLAPEGVGVLYDNGPLVNSVGTGSGGADESVLQNLSLGLNTLGFGHQVSALNRVADQFTIPDADGWHIDQITFYAYQTGSPQASTITEVNLRIWDGAPNGGGAVVWGDTSTNVLSSTSFSGIFRVTETTTGTATDRPIMANVVTVDLDLPAGTYWLDWQTNGSLGSGPWAPPITITGAGVTGDGLQSIADNGATWAAALDTGTGAPAQGLPFVIEGTILGGVNPLEIPTVGTWGILLMALALAGVAVARLR